VTKVADLDTPLNSTEEKIKNRLNRNIIQRFFDWMNSDIERDKYVSFIIIIIAITIWPL
jgi:hypothetical protein